MLFSNISYLTYLYIEQHIMCICYYAPPATLLYIFVNNLTFFENNLASRAISRPTTLLQSMAGAPRGTTHYFGYFQPIDGPKGSRWLFVLGDWLLGQLYYQSEGLTVDRMLVTSTTIVGVLGNKKGALLETAW